MVCVDSREIKKNVLAAHEEYTIIPQFGNQHSVLSKALFGCQLMAVRQPGNLNR